MPSPKDRTDIDEIQAPSYMRSNAVGAYLRLKAYNHPGNWARRWMLARNIKKPKLASAYLQSGADGVC